VRYHLRVELGQLPGALHDKNWSTICASAIGDRDAGKAKAH